MRGHSHTLLVIEFTKDVGAKACLSRIGRLSLLGKLCAVDHDNVTAATLLCKLVIIDKLPASKLHNSYRVDSFGDSLAAN
jgi:hypothetical protein